MKSGSLAEKWRLGQQPTDIRDAFVEVAFLLAQNSHGLKLNSNDDQVWRKLNLKRAETLVDSYLDAGKSPSRWKPSIWRDSPLRDLISLPVRWRAGHKCEDCREAHDLQFHHLNYRRFNFELPEDLLLLCGSCHLSRHEKFGYPLTLDWADPYPLSPKPWSFEHTNKSCYVPPVMDLATQHRAAVKLLRRLKLATVRLERRNGGFVYRAWDNPGRGNGSLRLKLGKVKAS